MKNVFNTYGYINSSSDGTGNVVGPISSTDNAIVRWDGITGKLIQDSNITIDDNDVINTPILTQINSNNINFISNPKNNTFIGKNSGVINTVGDNNVCLGSSSMIFVEGNDNIAIGNDVMNTLTTGDNNIGIGDFTLESVETGSDNIAIGNLAGSSVSAADSNTINIANPGASGSNYIRLGNRFDHLQTFIHGIHQVTPVGTNEMVIIDENDQLGSQIISASDVTSVENLVVDNDIVRFDSTTGKVINSSNINLQTISNASLVIQSGTGRSTQIPSENSVVLGFENLQNASNITNTRENIVIATNCFRTGSVISGANITDNILLGTNVCSNVSLSGGASFLRNIALGSGNMISCSGIDAGTSITDNICIGDAAGSLLTSGRHNIYLNNLGFAGAENGVIRLGNIANNTSAFIHGIHQVTPVGTNEMVIIDENGQLGSEPITIGGDVSGAASSTDNGIARFDGLTGKIIQNSSVNIDDFGVIRTPSTIQINAGNDSFISNNGFNNTFVGINIGSGTGGIGNSIFGHAAPLMTGNNNTGMGTFTFDDLTTGERNVGIGAGALNRVGIGSDNIALGYNAGASLFFNAVHTISIGNAGKDTNNTIIIGSSTNHFKTFIAGIHQVTPIGTNEMVIIDENDQLGSVPIQVISYGEMEIEDNVTATTITTSSTDFTNKVLINIWSTSVTNNMSATPASGIFTISSNGSYKVFVSLSLTGGTNDTYSFAFFQNGVTKVGTKATRRFSSGDVGSISFSSIISLTATDTLALYVQNETSTANIIIQDGSFSLHKIN